MSKTMMNPSLPPDLQSPDPEARDDDIDLIINTQRAMYETHINDLKERIWRLEERNDALETLCEQGKVGFDIQSSDAESQIVELNNSIAFQTKKNEENRRKCDELEALRELQRQNHLDKMNQVEEKFENTRIQMYSKIKAINAKVNTIDDFKLAEESLRGKYNFQRDETGRREEEMKKKLEQIELKAKMHKENLKKEAYEQILKESEIFQEDLRVIIPQNVQRLMRENIVFENELVQLWMDHSNMEDQQSNLKYRAEDCVDKIKVAKANTKRRMITAKIQGLLLKKIKAAYLTVENILSKLTVPPEDFEREYLNFLENTIKPEIESYDLRRRQLEVLLHRERLKRLLVDKFKYKTAFALEKCLDAAHNLKKVVNSTLLPNKPGVDETVKDMDLDSLGDYMLNIIDNCDSTMWITTTESVETVPDASNVYAIGDLGFEPKHIEIEDRTVDETVKIRSPSMESTFAILKELEELQEQLAAEMPKKPSSRRSSEVSISTDESAVSSVSKIEERKKEIQDTEQKVLRLSEEYLLKYEESYEYEDEMQDYLEDLLDYLEE